MQESKAASYVVTVDKLGTFTKGRVVTSADLGGHEERLLKKGAIRQATGEEIDSGVVHFAGEASAEARSLEARLVEQTVRSRLLEEENAELRSQLGEYRRPLTRTAVVGPTPEELRDVRGAIEARQCDLGVLAGSIAELEARAAATVDVDELRALLAGEKAKGEGARKGALAALEARIAAVESK
jgi:hypothetical protein